MDDAYEHQGYALYTPWITAYPENETEPGPIAAEISHNTELLASTATFARCSKCVQPSPISSTTQYGVGTPISPAIPTIVPMLTPAPITQILAHRS